MSARLIRLGALVPALLVLAPGEPLANGVGTGRMVVKPVRLVAGSTGNNLTFTFIATPRGLVGQTAVDVPVQWSRPQSRDASGKGYVALRRGTCSGRTAITSVKRRRILIRTSCRRGQTFTLTYSNATAARLTADGWVFLTQTRPAPKRGKRPPRFKPVAPDGQPVVVTTGGPAVELVVSAPGTVTVGIAFTITVRVNDRFGNPAGGYAGTVTFTTTDAKARVPQPVAFSGQGSRNVGGVVFNTPGTQRIGATDGGSLRATSGPITVIASG